MNKTYGFGLLSLAIALAGCGGGGSSGDDTTSTTDIPVSVSIEEQVISAGVPKGFEYTLPAPAEPYTEITIDLAETLEAAEITVTPSP